MQVTWTSRWSHSYEQSNEKLQLGKSQVQKELRGLARLCAGILLEVSLSDENSLLLCPDGFQATESSVFISQHGFSTDSRTIFRSYTMADSSTNGEGLPTATLATSPKLAPAAESGPPVSTTTALNSEENGAEETTPLLLSNHELPSDASVLQPPERRLFILTLLSLVFSVLTLVLIAGLWFIFWLQTYSYYWMYSDIIDSLHAVTFLVR